MKKVLLVGLLLVIFFGCSSKKNGQQQKVEKEKVQYEYLEKIKKYSVVGKIDEVLLIFDSGTILRKNEATKNKFVPDVFIDDKLKLNDIRAINIIIKNDLDSLFYCFNVIFGSLDRTEKYFSLANSIIIDEEIIIISDSYLSRNERIFSGKIFLEGEKRRYFHDGKYINLDKMF